ncbi:erythrocyte membrane protein 1, PfEMP1, putative [Plasmodium sp.]|nr:erythrocyte membrane protein 1, PfEMP1, putative [Plasmodium sp.]
MEGNGDTDDSDTTPYTNDIISSSSERTTHIPRHMTHGDTYYTSITQDTGDIFNTHISPDIHSIHTYNIHDMPSGNISTNKPISDNELNQLKQGFISQYLDHIGPDVPLNNEFQDDNMYMERQPNILDDRMDEKPFITKNFR